jgi:hypothetical protein
MAERELLCEQLDGELVTGPCSKLLSIFTLAFDGSCILAAANKEDYGRSRCLAAVQRMRAAGVTEACAAAASTPDGVKKWAAVTWPVCKSSGAASSLATMHS